VGLTSREQPSLWWHLWEETDTRIDVTVTMVNVEQPLLDVTLPPPTTAGWHGVHLGNHGVRLEKGKTYEWFVALVPDPEQRSRDIVAGGVIQYRDPSEAVRQELSAAGEKRSYEVFARHGYWYEAIANLSEQTESTPANPGPRAARAALLEQVGLKDLAELDHTPVSGR
jgi:hypothetical protein